MQKPFSYNPPGTGQTQQSISVSTNANNMSFYSQDGGMNGERIRVAVRIRKYMKEQKNILGKQLLLLPLVVVLAMF